MPFQPNVAGPTGQLYADPKPSTDEDAFQVDNTSEAYYNSVYYLANKNKVQPIPPRQAGTAPNINLQDYLPASMMNAINAVLAEYAVVGATPRLLFVEIKANFTDNFFRCRKKWIVW